jgi:HEAT repeat protein
MGTVVSAAESDLAKSMAALASPDQEQQLEAEDALGDLGAQAAEAIPLLLAKLADDNAEIRWHACRALGGIGAKPEVVVPALTKALADPDPQVRAYAAYALGRFGKAALPAVEALIGTALDKEPLVSRVSMQAIRAIEPPPDQIMPVWLKALESSDPAVASTAIRVFAEQGKQVVPRMRQLLKHERAAYWACLVLAELGTDAADAVPELGEVVKHGDPDVRLEALLALGHIGKAAAAVTPQILERLDKDTFPHVRVAAAYTLASIGSASPEAKKSLLAAQQADDSLLRLVSAWALAELYPEDEPYVDRAVELVLAALSSSDAALKSAGARILVELPPGERPLVAKRLVAALDASDPSAVANVIDALAAFGPKSVPEIMPALQKPGLRRYALRVLNHLGPQVAATAVPALLKTLDQLNDDAEAVEFRREAHFLLAQIGPAAKEAVPYLIGGLDAQNEEVRSSAAYALGKIGPDAREALPRLRQMIEGDSNEKLRRLAVWTVLRLSPGNPRLQARALPILIGALQHERELVRVEAALTLGDLGAIAKPALPALKERFSDSSAAVQNAAKEAVQKIEGSAGR